MGTNMPPQGPPYPPPGGPPNPYPQPPYGPGPGQPPPPYGQPPQYGQQPPYGMPPGPPMKKKTSPWVWVLVGLGVFLLLVGGLVVAGGYYAYSKVKQAGIDPGLLRSNPAMAIAKMATASNPDLEVLSADDTRGIIRVREKSTGKTYTLSFEDAKRGKIVLQEDGKDAVTIEGSGSGDSGGVKVSSAEGTVNIGSGGKLPDWVPAYPGATAQNVYSAASDEGSGGTAQFTSKDGVDQVAKYYADALKAAGFRVSTTTMSGDDAGAVVSGENAAAKRTIGVTVAAETGGSAVTIMYSQK